MTRLEELVKQKQEEIKKTVESVKDIFVTVDAEISEERYNICLKCEEFREVTKQCKICNCFMPMKVKFKVTECPKHYWTKAITEN